MAEGGGAALAVLGLGSAPAPTRRSKRRREPSSYARPSAAQCRDAMDASNGERGRHKQATIMSAWEQHKRYVNEYVEWYGMCHAIEEFY